MADFLSDEVFPAVPFNQVKTVLEPRNGPDAVDDYDRSEPDFTDPKVIASFIADHLDGIDFDSDCCLIMGSDCSAPDGDLRLTVERVTGAPYDSGPDIYTPLVKWRVALTKEEVDE